MIRLRIHSRCYRTAGTLSSGRYYRKMKLRDLRVPRLMLKKVMSGCRFGSAVGNPLLNKPIRIEKD